MKQTSSQIRFIIASLISDNGALDVAEKVDR